MSGNCWDLNSSTIPPNIIIDFNFSNSINCPITKDVNYFIVFSSPNSTNTSSYQASAANGGDIYTKGITFLSLNNGASWQPEAMIGKDFYFLVWTDTNRLFADFNANKIRDLNSSKPLADMNGIYDFNFTGSFGQSSFKDANWFVDGVRKKTLSSLVDLNFHYEGFSIQKDYNISLILKATDNNVSQKNLILSVADVGLSVNNINIIPQIIAYSSLGGADVNFTVSFTDANINYFVWGGFQDGNKIGQTINADFNAQNIYNICVTLQSIADHNSTYCEPFYLSNVIIKIPKNEKTLVNITPFNITVFGSPVQSYSSISSDQNFWFFWQEPSVKKFFVDVNLSFYPRNYVHFLSPNQLQEVIQPYLVSIIDGIQVVFTALDILTLESVPNVNLVFSRNISGLGNVMVQGGSTDSLGQSVFSFITEIDHNFSIYLDLNFLVSGIYTPIISNATNGVNVQIDLTEFNQDFNVFGTLDVNYLQSSIVNVGFGNYVDLNQVVDFNSTNLSITNVRIIIDQNNLLLYDQNFSSGISNGGTFGQTFIAVISSIQSIRHRMIFTFSNGVIITRTKFFTPNTAQNLINALSAVRDSELGVGGAMLLLSFLMAIFLGVLYINFPTIHNDHAFIIPALVFSVGVFLGWVDGVSWIFACLAAGVIYYMRRLE